MKIRMEYKLGGTAKLLDLPKNLKIRGDENMVKVTNVSDGILGFKDDDKQRHILKPKESIECNLKRSQDPRFVLGEEKVEDKKKKVGGN